MKIERNFSLFWISPYKIRKIYPLGTFQSEDVKAQIKLDLVYRDALKRVTVNSPPIHHWYKPSRRR